MRGSWVTETDVCVCTRTETQRDTKTETQRDGEATRDGERNKRQEDGMERGGLGRRILKVHTLP